MILDDRSIVPGEVGRLLPPCDSPAMFRANDFAFSARALKVLRGVLRGGGEILPLDVPGRDYKVFNPTRVIPALDEQRSVIRRGAETGDLLGIDRHVFLPEVVRGEHIFRLPYALLRTVYVDEEFVKAVEDAGLIGFRLTRVWPL
jgi:hypothetical protein